MERMSPRRSSYGPGMPWTTIELGEVQIEPGKPRYPLKEGVAPWERMNFSGSSSSCFVVTPGRALERSILRQRAWMSPAAAIASICSEVLRMIIPRYMVLSVSHTLLVLSAQSREHRVNPLLDLVGWMLALHPLEDPLVLEVVDQWLGLLVVLREAVLDHLWLVVVADDQLASVEVADSILRRGVEVEVIDVARVLLAGAAAAEAADDLLFRDFDQDRGGQVAMELTHLRLERLSLRERAGEAVQD